jgi:DeoR/GlpR family transcriptional regulator of sugar metabolism
MLAIERRTDIFRLLKQDGRVRVSELSKRYSVTEETIRRDLEKMSREGLAIKSHGGAILNENTNIELPFNTRMKRNIEGKQLLAATVAEFIRDGTKLMMDASSTSVFIAKALRKKQQMTVITNSIEIIVEMADKAHVELISTGGGLDRHYLAFTGPKTIRALSEYNPEIAVLSCQGLDMTRGIMDSTDAIADTKKAMITAARTVILATDYTKFNQFALSHIGPITEIDILITDRDPGPEWRDFLEERNVECIFPKS